MYYPKSKVQENLYTSGGEFIISSTNKNYEGLYHATFDGNYFTGATHTASSQPLSKKIATPTTTSGSSLVSAPYSTNFQYDVITKNRFSYLSQEVIPTAFFPIVTDQDYSNGSIVRYFALRVGGSASDIKEISSDGYSDLKTNVLYLTTSVQWKLTGPYHDQVINLHNTIYGVFDTNARTVANAESSLPGITQYLTNLTQFAKFI